MVKLKEKRHPLGVGRKAFFAISGINGFIKHLMRPSEVRRHGNWVVEVGQR